MTEFEIEQCGTAQVRGGSGSASGSAPLREVKAAKFLDDNPLVVSDRARVAAEQMQPLLDQYQDLMVRSNKDLLDIDGTTYERSGLDRAIGLTGYVANGREAQISRAPDLVKDSLGYQSGRANAGDVPPVAVKALMDNIPVVLPHISASQARGILDAYPLDRQPNPPRSAFAQSQSETYYRNIRMAQAQALRVLKDGGDRDHRAYEFAVKKLE